MNKTKTEETEAIAPAQQPAIQTGMAAGGPGSQRWLSAAIGLALVLLVFAVFGGTARQGFINFDDNEYVYQAPIIYRGLTLPGIAWAFTHVHAGNWHPLTTIIHMLGCQLYGLWAGGHHLTNVLFHAAAVVFLFLLLREMTGFVWRSAFVAAVFAVHPLRVESVAWVSELKDVLSGMFFMLTLLAYARYARRPSPGRYALLMLWYALGLLSKPMLVTVPFLLLLLDYWPLRRLDSLCRLPRLVKEKLPLLALCLLSCLATVIAQRNAMGLNAVLPLSRRLANAVVAVVVYIGKFVWPARLAILYPLPPNGPQGWVVFGSALLIAALTAGALILGRKQPCLPVGWFWFLGMLVPVIGIIQVGGQAYADRYTYLPEIGLLIAIVWPVADWAQPHPNRAAAMGALGAVTICALALATLHQLGYWRSAVTLWSHTIDCTQDNYFAQDELGGALALEGRTTEAIAWFRAALRTDPHLASAHRDLGDALLETGQPVEALAQCREAVRLKPLDAYAHYSLGNALHACGQLDQAIREYQAAIRIQPQFLLALNNLGNAFLAQGRLPEAAAEFRLLLRTDPGFADGYNNLGNALSRMGDAKEAIGCLRQAVRLKPEDVNSRINLAMALSAQGDEAGAIESLRAAIQQIGPKPPLETSLAWLLATASDASLRDGQNAVAIATKASESTGGASNPFVLRTLAAAYAQAGLFPDAVRTAQTALRLAYAQNNTALAGALSREIKLYQAGHPFEEAR